MANNFIALCLLLKTFWKLEIKSDGLVHLIEEVSNQQNIQALTLALFAAFLLDLQWNLGMEGNEWKDLENLHLVREMLGKKHESI
jgi:hypothetical protein